ncbi:hypothetical protein ACWD3Z_40855 [Streptomyces sp. NPDC002740]
MSESLLLTAGGPAQLPTLTPLDKDACPTELRPSFAILRRRLHERTDVAVSAGRDDKGRFVLVVASSEASVHMRFETEWRHGRQFASPATIDPIRVVTADGKDLTEEANGELKEALSRLLAAPPGSGASEAVADSAQGNTGRRSVVPQEHGPARVAIRATPTRRGRGRRPWFCDPQPAPWLWRHSCWALCRLTHALACPHLRESTR